MRHPTSRYRISGQAIPEVVEALEVAATKLGRRLRFRDRKLKEGPLLVALTIYCLTRPDCEMEEMTRIGLAKYEELLASDEQGQLKQELVLGGCQFVKGQPAIELPLKRPNSENASTGFSDRPSRIRGKR